MNKFKYKCKWKKQLYHALEKCRNIRLNYGAPLCSNKHPEKKNLKVYLGKWYLKHIKYVLDTKWQTNTDTTVTYSYNDTITTLL